ncbi:hypothetical protein [Cognatilysobacter terrigena]|uniref:hypothetical protein n=1 Tax=Cognatilysobacter terrigena TaxID=2488749 RepID=UPI00105E8333|nr:hypothetical protein [Lysobacter terrigena]
MSIALVAIGVVAGVGLFLTDLPIVATCAAAPACALWGFVLARGERARMTRRFVLHADGRVVVDDAPAEDLRVDWQGPVASLTWTRDARRQRLVAWPDVLDAAQRRELRLWALTRLSRAAPAAVAP